MRDAQGQSAYGLPAPYELEIVALTTGKDSSQLVPYAFYSLNIAMSRMIRSPNRTCALKYLLGQLFQNAEG